MRLKSNLRYTRIPNTANPFPPRLTAWRFSSSSVTLVLSGIPCRFLSFPPLARHPIGEAAKRTTALIYAYKFPDTATEEQRVLLEQYRRRFEAQLKGAPDLQAPLDKEGRQKHYFRFDNFIRAMIYQELKS